MLENSWALLFCVYLADHPSCEHIKPLGKIQFKPGVGIHLLSAHQD